MNAPVIVSTSTLRRAVALMVLLQTMLVCVEVRAVSIAAEPAAQHRAIRRRDLAVFYSGAELNGATVECGSEQLTGLALEVHEPHWL